MTTADAGDPPIRFSCDCGQEIEVPAGMAGQQGRCPGCDEVVAIPAPREPEPLVRACPFCGRQIQAAAVRCRHCGSDQSAPAPESPVIDVGRRDPTQQPEAERQARLGLVFGVIAFALPCAAVALGPLAISAGKRAQELARRGRFPVPSSAMGGIVLGWLGLAMLMMLGAAALLLVGLARMGP